MKHPWLLGEGLESSEKKKDLIIFDFVRWLGRIDA